MDKKELIVSEYRLFLSGSIYNISKTVMGIIEDGYIKYKGNLYGGTLDEFFTFLKTELTDLFYNISNSLYCGEYSDRYYDEFKEAFDNIYNEMFNHFKAINFKRLKEVYSYHKLTRKMYVDPNKKKGE